MPKISVLMPLYNRRHYVEDAINSVLIQTFSDYELIVCDDGSTDGSADFVAKKFSAEISSGRVKLLRNEKNLGEFPTDNKLIRAAAGKYIMLLHSDDLFLREALANMYDAAEYFNADVVHAGLFLQSPADGVINANTQFKVMCWENRIVKNFETVPENPETRFKEWAEADTFVDAQYNIFRRQFLLDNEIFFPNWMANIPFALHWLMKAKIYVKTPEIFYVRRDAPDSYSNDKRFFAKRIRRFIRGTVEISEWFNELFQRVRYFKDNPAEQYRAKAIFFDRADSFRLNRLKIYEHGITPELQLAAAEELRANFGDGADYLEFMFHKLHCLPFDQDYRKILGGSNAFH